MLTRNAIERFSGDIITVLRSEGINGTDIIKILTQAKQSALATYAKEDDMEIERRIKSHFVVDILPREQMTYTLAELAELIEYNGVKTDVKKVLNAMGFEMKRVRCMGKIKVGYRLPIPKTYTKLSEATEGED